MDDGDIAAMRFLCSPGAEAMPDGTRLTALIHKADGAADEIERLRGGLRDMINAFGSATPRDREQAKAIFQAVELLSPERTK